MARRCRNAVVMEVKSQPYKVHWDVIVACFLSVNSKILKGYKYKTILPPDKCVCAAGVSVTWLSCYQTQTLTRGSVIISIARRWSWTWSPGDRKEITAVRPWEDTQVQIICILYSEKLLNSPMPPGFLDPSACGSEIERRPPSLMKNEKLKSTLRNQGERNSSFFLNNLFFLKVGSLGSHTWWETALSTTCGTSHRSSAVPPLTEPSKPGTFTRYWNTIL